MSAEASGNHLAPMLMRSQTPGHNEKVLDYLEGMSRDEVDSKPPRSLLDHTEYRSQGSRSRGPSRVQSPASKRSDAGNDANGKEDDGEDYDSTTQERSENGDEAEILHVPGPKDPRGPRHESYDSGPSFGNLGPLPDESTFDPHWGNHKPPSDFAALGGKAVSPKHSSFHFDVETPSGKGSPNHFAPSVGPQSPKTDPNSPKSSGRAPTADAYRPLSPQSNQSRKTRNSERPYHQPLPESHIGEHDMPLSPVSPIRSVAPSRKAASHVSVSPSDSLSQYHVRSSKKSKANGSTAQEEASQARAPTQNGKSASHHSRPFSPYRHAPTTEDLLYAVVRDRVVPIEEQPSQELSKAPSTIKPARSEHPVPSVVSMAKSHSSSPSKAPKAPSAVSSQRTAKKKDVDATPTPTRPGTPGDAKVDDDDEFVRQVLASAGTPRTSKSYTGSVLGSDIVNSHFHDNDLCVLFQFLNDDRSPDQVKKVLRKAIRRRVKDLGMKYDNESIREIQKSHQHQGFGGTEIGDMEEPPKWASDLKREIVLMQQRIESLGPKIENLRPGGAYQDEGDRFIDVDDDDDYTHTPVTQTVNIHTQATGTLAESAFQPETEIIVEEEDDGHGNLPEQAFEEITETGPARRFPHLNGDLSQEYDRDDSPGQQYLEEELYKLRQKPASQSGRSHHSWELAQNDEAYEDEENQRAIAPTIPGSEAGYENAPAASASNHSLATIPQPNYGEDSGPRDGLLPWQRIHQRLLSWAIVWPMSEFDDALSSTMRGRQVNEVAMSIWSTQTYKRYVRSRLTDNPKQPVDRLFVPPNMADAINNAVFNGRHGDACGMLRDLWAPFGLPGMPRLLVVLAKHRSDENHWVVHRFSLPEGLLTTYDSYPEKTLPDGRPLGWWFAIRVAWPTALYPNPDHLIQKMVRLHRPMQRSVDNSLAAGGIWRNVLMGSRPERSLDLERLRDLINTEVKNLRQRKQVGKLSISAPQPTWEDMNMN